jgi:hypothetical protein
MEPRAYNPRIQEMAMNTCRKSARPVLVMLAVAAVVAQSGVSAAVARDHGQRQPSARPLGSYSHQTQVQRTEGGYTRNSTATNAQGQTTTRNATGTYDPGTKTWIKDVSVNRGDGG